MMDNRRASTKADGAWETAVRELMGVKLDQRDWASTVGHSRIINLLVSAIGAEFDALDTRVEALEAVRADEEERAHEDEVGRLRDRIAELEQRLLWMKKERDEAIAKASRIGLQFSDD